MEDEIKINGVIYIRKNEDKKIQILNSDGIWCDFDESWYDAERYDEEIKDLNYNNSGIRIFKSGRMGDIFIYREVKK